MWECHIHRASKHDVSTAQSHSIMLFGVLFSTSYTIGDDLLRYVTLLSGRNSRSGSLTVSSMIGIAGWLECIVQQQGSDTEQLMWMRDWRLSCTVVVLYAWNFRFLWLFAHVECVDDADCIKWCLLDIQGTRQSGHLKKTSWDFVRGDMESCRVLWGS